MTKEEVARCWWSGPLSSRYQENVTEEEFECGWSAVVTSPGNVTEEEFERGWSAVVTSPENVTENEFERGWSAVVTSPGKHDRRIV